MHNYQAAIREVLADLLVGLIKLLLCSLNFFVAYWLLILSNVHAPEPERRQLPH